MVLGRAVGLPRLDVHHRQGEDVAITRTIDAGEDDTRVGVSLELSEQGCIGKVDAQLARAVDRTVTDTDSAQGAEGFLRTASVVIIQRDRLDKGASDRSAAFPQLAGDTRHAAMAVEGIRGHRGAGQQGSSTIASSLTHEVETDGSERGRGFVNAHLVRHHTGIAHIGADISITTFDREAGLSSAVSQAAGSDLAVRHSTSIQSQRSVGIQGDDSGGRSRDSADTHDLTVIVGIARSSQTEPLTTLQIGKCIVTSGSDSSSDGGRSQSTSSRAEGSAGNTIGTEHSPGILQGSSHQDIVFLILQFTIHSARGIGSQGDHGTHRASSVDFLGGVLGDLVIQGFASHLEVTAVAGIGRYTESHFGNVAQLFGRTRGKRHVVSPGLGMRNCKVDRIITQGSDKCVNTCTNLSRSLCINPKRY